MAVAPTLRRRKRKWGGGGVGVVGGKKKKQTSAAPAPEISEATLSKFHLGQRGLSMTAMDRLGEYLGLMITLVRKPSKKGK